MITEYRMPGGRILTRMPGAVDPVRRVDAPTAPLGFFVYRNWRAAVRYCRSALH